MRQQRERIVCIAASRSYNTLEMGDFTQRAIIPFLASELLPVRFRMMFMRRLGYQFHKTSCLWAGANLRSNKMRMDEGAFVNVGFFHDGYAQLTIRANVRIGQFVRVITASHDIGPPHQRCPLDVLGGPVEIKDGCWIGSGVTIMPNVTIESGCVIAANAVVMESTEPNGFYAGNPAQFVRDLGP